MSASAVKAAVAWLITAVTSNVTAVSGHDLYVGYGEPLNDEPDDQVYLVDVRSDAQRIGMGTPTAVGAMSEADTIPLWVSVYRAGDDGKAAFERCCDVVNTIVALVRADPTLGGSVLDAHPGQVTYPSPAATESGTGRLCETELIFECLTAN